MLEKLGNSFYFNSNLEKANLYYKELFDSNEPIEPEYYYRYSQCLKAQNNYKKANEVLLQFNQKSGNDTRAKLASSQKDYLAWIEKNSGRYIIDDAKINSQFSDYGSSFYNNKVIFASARDTGVVGSNSKHSWTGESFTNLYFSDMNDEGFLLPPKKFGKLLNTKFHESTPVFTKDGKTVYFTRNNFMNGKKGKDNNQTTLLKIYKASLNGDNWENIKVLPFNSDNYNVAHPTLSEDGKVLYFASDMPGTIGQSDLFKVAINDDGTFGKPENLGNGINTEGKETFPMITSDNELYFASDGHPGLGGLDVFVSKQQVDGTFKHVQNVGKPVNSQNDDFAFLINKNKKIGFFSSNRAGGKGGDDIYRFVETKEAECQQFLSGVAIDSYSGLPLANVSVTLSDSNFNVIEELITDSEGKFDFGIVHCGSKNYIKAIKQSYKTIEIPQVIKEAYGETKVVIELPREVEEVKKGDDIGDLFGKDLKIYFDFDKFKIRQDAEIELRKILDVLEQNPTMKIAIGSHTDCRQNAKYNLALSERRAKSTLEWFIANGISKSRITAKGYGESKLLNKCECDLTNKSDCTEEEHQANRRSEFIVTDL
ncbi:OmpA family protein [Flavobacterium sp. A45]|uniref:OmpA family protein n=1 Tax=Flavobacterium sp. A45 TaxID=1945862 RepID=UPI0020C32109|nr:OmpA family protein [Flavobacterium sp. A45]